MFLSFAKIRQNNGHIVKTPIPTSAISSKHIEIFVTIINILGRNIPDEETYGQWRGKHSISKYKNAEVTEGQLYLKIVQI